jgi:hypothetical protein
MTEGHGGARSITSNCILFASIARYKTASEGSVSNPCHNVPIFCELCPVEDRNSKTVVWHYNYLEHLSLFHQTYARPGSSTPDKILLPYPTWSDMALTELEQTRAGIPLEKRTPAFAVHKPPPDNVISTGTKRGNTTVHGGVSKSRRLGSREHECGEVSGKRAVFFSPINYS